MITPKSEVFLLDCVEGMKRYADNYFDLAIVDPPYGININHNIGRRKGDKPSKNKKVIWDNEIPTDEYFEQLFRVSKNQIIWGANYFNMPPTKCFIIWDKPQMCEDVTFAMCEYAWTSFNTTAKVFRKHLSELDKIHPTQKPIKLYEWILKNYAKQGNKILDTHLGSGSSRIAAYKNGYDFTAFEIDKEYFEAQEKRFKTFIAQQRLF